MAKKAACAAWVCVGFNGGDGVRADRARGHARSRRWSLRVGSALLP